MTVRTIGIPLLLAASLLACATPDKYVPTDAADAVSSPDAPGMADVLGTSPDAPAGTLDVAGLDQGNGSAPDVGSLDTAIADVSSPPPDGPCGTLTDPRNCGTCGHDCTKLANIATGGMVSCQAGKCVVPAGACATGYAHCSSNVEDGCETNLSRPETCGRCDSKCSAGDLCSASGGSYQCVSACSGGTPDKCGSSCANLQTDPRNCGTCGNDCTRLPHVNAGSAISCSAGKCVLGSGACVTGWENCDVAASTGCEADLSRTDTCGACNVTCGAGKVCSSSGGTFQCACPLSMPSMCGSACINLQTDSQNCGSCGHSCASLPNLKAGAPVSCAGGQCMILAGSCATGYGNCSTSNPDDGCETMVSSNQNCGACNATCSGGKTCQNYTCSCPTAQPDTCSGACVNLKEDPNNCGVCGHSCLGGPCAGGQCQPVQLYSGGDATYAYTFDSQYIYFIREKDNNPNLRLISRISKADGSGFTDIWATDIGPYGDLVLVNGILYWSGQNDIMGCPAPSCAGGPQVKVANQSGDVFSDVARSNLYWIANDPLVAGQKDLMRLGVSTPLTTSTNDIRNGTADRDFVYLNEGLDDMIRVSTSGGSKTSVGSGYDPVINSSKIVFSVATPAIQGGGSSPAMTSALLSPLGSARMTVGNYGTSYTVWGGIVVDEQDAYWMIFCEEKVTGLDNTFIFKCPLSGCGTNPTVLAKGNYPLGRLKSDGQALFTTGSGIYKLAK